MHFLELLLEIFFMPLKTLKGSLFVLFLSALLIGIYLIATDALKNDSSDIKEAKRNLLTIECHKDWSPMTYIKRSNEYRIEDGLVIFKHLGIEREFKPEYCKAIK